MQRVKVEVAKSTLEKGRKSIFEVMNEVGYSDDKAFREVFKKITGVSPLDYKARYNKQAVLVQVKLAVQLALLVSDGFFITCNMRGLVINTKSHFAHKPVSPACSLSLLTGITTSLTVHCNFSKSKNEDTFKSYFWMLLNDNAKKPN